MDTTSVAPEYPPGGGMAHKPLQENKQLFQEGEFVLMRSKRIEQKEILRFNELYGKTLPIETWWSYIGKEYNKQIEYCKDADDDGGYYMFHTKYIGKVKQSLPAKTNSSDLFGNKMYIVEWEVRGTSLFPGETLTRVQEHYAENLISLSKMTVMTKEEILDDVLKWALKNNA